MSNKSLYLFSILMTLILFAASVSVGVANMFSGGHDYADFAEKSVC